MRRCHRGLERLEISRSEGIKPSLVLGKLVADDLHRCIEVIIDAAPMPPLIVDFAVRFEFLAVDETNSAIFQIHTGKACPVYRESLMPIGQTHDGSTRRSNRGLFSVLPAKGFTFMFVLAKIIRQPEPALA